MTTKTVVLRPLSIGRELLMEYSVFNESDHKVLTSAVVYFARDVGLEAFDLKFREGDGTEPDTLTFTLGTGRKFIAFILPK